MTGPEHYREAERLLAATQDGAMLNSAALRADAQVHAILALAAATALANYRSNDMTEGDQRGWYEAASGHPEYHRARREAERAEFGEEAQS